MSNKKYLRSVLSTFIAMAIALSGIVIALALSIKLGWTNERVLKNEMTNKSYVSKSITLMKEEIYALVKASISDTSGLEDILKEDSLYTVFYNAEAAALRGETVNMNDTEAFRSSLTAFFDTKLNGIYRTESVERTVNNVIDESVRIYGSYMHPSFFANFYDIRQKVNDGATAAIVISIVVIVLGMLALPGMYHYRRHAYPYAVGGFVAAIICNILYVICTLRSGWVAASGIEPECYRGLATSMTHYGGYVGLIVTGIEVIVLCFICYFIKKSKKH